VDRVEKYLAIVAAVLSIVSALVAICQSVA
jgi:hypothetical protein